MQSEFNCLSLKIKQRMLQDTTFIHSGMGNAIADKLQENKSKIRRSRYRTLTKKGCTQVARYFGCKLHSIIESDYDLIRNSIITALLYI